jgi:hypothetical protein
VIKDTPCLGGDFFIGSQQRFDHRYLRDLLYGRHPICDNFYLPTPSDWLILDIVDYCFN